MVTAVLSSLPHETNAHPPLESSSLNPGVNCRRPSLNSTLTGVVTIANCNQIRIANLILEYGSGLRIVNESNVILQNIIGLGTVTIEESEQVRIFNFTTGVSITGSDSVLVSGGFSQRRPFNHISVSSSSRIAIRDNLHTTITLDNDSQVQITNNNFSPRCCTTDFTTLRMVDVDHVAIMGNRFHSDLDILGLNISSVKIANNRIDFSDLNAVSLNKVFGHFHPG